MVYYLASVLSAAASDQLFTNKGVQPAARHFLKGPQLIAPLCSLEGWLTSRRWEMRKLRYTLWFTICFLRGIAPRPDAQRLFHLFSKNPPLASPRRPPHLFSLLSTLQFLWHPIRLVIEKRISICLPVSWFLLHLFFFFFFPERDPGCLTSVCRVLNCG